MAKMTGRSVSLLSQIEKGKVNPSFSSMQNIADVLNVPLSQLILKNEGTVENDLESIIDKQEWENGIPNGKPDFKKIYIEQKLIFKIIDVFYIFFDSCFEN